MGESCKEPCIEYDYMPKASNPYYCTKCDLESHLSKFTKTAQKHIMGLISLYDCECPAPLSGSCSDSESYLPYVEDEEELLDAMYAEYKRERKELKECVVKFLDEPRDIEYINNDLEVLDQLKNTDLDKDDILSA